MSVPLAIATSCSALRSAPSFNRFLRFARPISATYRSTASAMKRLRSPFFATRSMSRTVSSGKVMLRRRCRVDELLVIPSTIHTDDVYVKGLSRAVEGVPGPVPRASATGSSFFGAQGASRVMVEHWGLRGLPDAGGRRPGHGNRGSISLHLPRVLPFRPSPGSPRSPPSLPAVELRRISRTGAQA